jgi:hypothetical protein
MAGFDHVFLHVRSKAMLRTEDGSQRRSRVRGQPIDDVDELMIDRGRVADDPDTVAVETGRRKQAFRSQRDAQAANYRSCRVTVFKPNESY